MSAVVKVTGPWTDEEMRYVEEATARFDTPAQIADHLNREVVSLYNKLRVLGAPVGNPRVPWTDAQIETLRRHHADGLSCSRSAAELGRKFHVVANKKKQLGLTSANGGMPACGTKRPQNPVRAMRKVRPRFTSAFASQVGSVQHGIDIGHQRIEVLEAEIRDRQARIKAIRAEIEEAGETLRMMEELEKRIAGRKIG